MLQAQSNRLHDAPAMRKQDFLHGYLSAIMDIYV